MLTAAEGSKQAFFSNNLDTTKMKRIYFAFALALLATIGANAQSIFFENIYKDFREDDAAVTISMDGNLISLASWFAEEVEDKEVLSELGKNIDHIMVVVLEENDGLMTNEEVRELKSNLINKEGFEELMIVREGGQVVEVLAIEGDGIIKEIVLLANEGEEMVMMDVWGKIDLQNIDALVDAMDMK